MHDIGDDDGVMERSAPAVDAGAVGLEGDDRVMSEAAARSAIGLRHLRPEQPERPRLQPDGAVDLSFFLPALVMRLALGLEEPARLVGQHVEFLGHPGRLGQTEDRHDDVPPIWLTAPPS
jgi:hypothetical protein